MKSDIINDKDSPGGLNNKWNSLADLSLKREISFKRAKILSARQSREIN